MRVHVSLLNLRQDHPKNNAIITIKKNKYGYIDWLKLANLLKLSLHTCVYITGYKIRHGVHSFNFQFRYSKYPTFRRSIIIAPNIKYSAILMERSEGEIIFVPMLFAIFLKNILSIWIYILSMKAKLNEIVTAGGIPRGVFFSMYLQQ